METKAQIEHEILCRVNGIFLLTEENNLIWDDVFLQRIPLNRSITIKVIDQIVCQIIDGKVVFWQNGRWFYKLLDLKKDLSIQKEILKTNQIWSNPK